MKFCENDCLYLNMTEARQYEITAEIKRTPPHFCLKYNQELKHGVHHPKLIACEGCSIVKDENSD